MATTRNLVPPGAIGNGLTMSIPYCEKGHTSIRPALEPSELEAPSVNNFHAFSGSGSFLFASLSFAPSSSFEGFSARKSAILSFVSRPSASKHTRRLFKASSCLFCDEDLSWAFGQGEEQFVARSFIGRHFSCFDP
nr:hypothetical protein [Tanacetum cinerariifolium]